MILCQKLLIIFLPILIILSNTIYFVFNENYYIQLTESFYGENSTQYTQTGLKVMDYIRGQKQLEQNIFSLQAQIHLMEVKSLFSLVLVTNLFCALIVLMTFSLLFLKKEINLIKYALFYSSVLTLAFILAVSVFTYINFDFWFKMLHQILFRDNLWLFEPDDILVKIFPAQFFSESLLLVSTNIVFCVIILLLTSKIFTKNAR